MCWAIFLFLTVIFVSWPVKYFLAVCWVYGTQGYFHDGIRALRVKPPRFSNGAPVPMNVDIVTGFGTFFATVLGLTLLLIFTLRFYQRLTKKRIR
jgi:hypothetical protein